MVMTRNSTTGEGRRLQNSVSGAGHLVQGQRYGSDHAGSQLHAAAQGPGLAAHLHPPAEDGHRVSGVVAGERGG